MKMSHSGLDRVECSEVVDLQGYMQAVHLYIVPLLDLSLREPGGQATCPEKGHIRFLLRIP